MKRLRHYKERRRKEAQERDEARAKRSPQNQLARLDKKLGKDQGAKKERKRLKAQIEITKRVNKDKEYKDDRNKQE